MTATATRRGYAFTDLTLPNRILRGVGRKVDISFTMDAEDSDYANRVVEVSLDGLEDVNGDNVIYVTPEAGSRVVTIEGLLTTSDNGAVQFTVNTTGYDTANSTRVTNRPRGTFTPVSYTYGGQTVTNIPTIGGEDVTFNFNLSDWEEGMAVNVVLDGFESADGSLETPATRAVSYVYYPQAAGSHSIKLKSTAGAKTCKVSLSADGFDGAEGTLTQSDIQTITIATTARLSFTWNGTQAPNTTTITLPDNPDAEISYTKATYGGNGKNRTLTITNLKIVGSGLSDDTRVTIVASRNQTRTTINTTIGELRGN